MAGSRPSGFRKAGGFLNNVDGVIMDYSFVTEFPGGKGGKRKGSDFNPLYVLLTAQEDGKSDPSTTTFFAGSSDDFEISDDGKTLTPVDDTVALRDGTAWSKFITSMVNNGFDESGLPEDEVNFEAIIGQRVRFVQVKDEEAMARFAKTWAASKGKYNAQGQKAGKDGKFYDIRNTEVSEVYGAESGIATGRKTGAGRAARPTTTGVSKTTTTSPSKVTKPVGGKPNGKSVEVDLTDEVDELLVKIATKLGGSVRKAQLGAQTQLALKPNHPNKDAIRSRIYDDEYLQDAVERGLITYDADDKKQTISLVE